MCYKKNVLNLFVVFFFLICVSNGFCTDIGRIPGKSITGFNHLLQLVTLTDSTFDSRKVMDILDHVSSDNFQSDPVYEGGLSKSPSAYYGFLVNSDLKSILRYCYNPEIPSCAVMPSVIRLSSWKNLNGKDDTGLSELLNRVDDYTAPVVYKGIYYMQNTPDVNTGTYYGYDSYRTVVLLKYKGRNALISILKQKDISDVGRKGYILGEDEELDYYYSGEQGVGKFGLGWVKSYLYDSFSVSIYVESDSKEKLVKCGSFKWLRAGWAGKNMIRKKHIKKGLVRFASVYKDILESNVLPPPEDLAEICKRYAHLSVDDMKKKMDEYIAGLQVKYGCMSSCPKILKAGFDREEYINGLSREEMSSALIVDYVKHALVSKDSLEEIAFVTTP